MLLSQLVRSDDASDSWLCHLGEKPFFLCLCLGCCVSSVFNTELDNKMPAREAHWGTGLKRNRPLCFNLSGLPCWQETTAQKMSQSHTARRGPGPTLQEGHGEVTGLCGYPGIKPHMRRMGAASFKETACQSRVNTTTTTTTTTAGTTATATNNQQQQQQPQPTTATTSNQQQPATSKHQQATS